MEDNEKTVQETVGEMNKRRETMADGERYIIYYTFGGGEEKESEAKENV